MPRTASASKSSSSSSGTSDGAPSGGGSGRGAGSEGGGNQAQNVPAIIPFALTPGQANTAVPIDYTSKRGIKLFNSDMMKPPDNLDGESKKINLKLAERAKQSGWMETGANVTMVEDIDGIRGNLIIEYGILTVEDINSSVQKLIGQKTCQAQNSVHIFHCLTNYMA